MKTPRNRNFKNASCKPGDGYGFDYDSHNKSRTGVGMHDLSHISPFSHKLFNFSGTGASFKIGGQPTYGQNYYANQSSVAESVTKKGKNTHRDSSDPNKNSTEQAYEQ